MSARIKNSKDPIKLKLPELKDEKKLIEPAICDNILEIRRKQILDYIESQDENEFKRIAKKYKVYFELCNANKTFLETNLINKYPLCSPDKISSFKTLYDESDLSLMDKKLFEIKDEFSNEKSKLRTPPVTLILRFSESPQNRLLLNQWKYKKIEELGFKGFESFSNDLKNRGTVFHKTIEDFSNSGKNFEDINVEKLYEPAWKSLSDVFSKDITRILFTECSVIHENLCYNGKFDSMCCYKDKIYIVDWKIGDKRKDKLRDLYDYPLQLVAYLAAFLVDNRYSVHRKEYDIKNVMVVHAYIDGSPPSIHCLNFHQIVSYWTKYLGRLQKFWINIKNGSMK